MVLVNASLRINIRRLTVHPCIIILASLSSRFVHENTRHDRPIREEKNTFDVYTYAYQSQPRAHAYANMDENTLQANTIFILTREHRYKHAHLHIDMHTYSTIETSA